MKTIKILLLLSCMFSVTVFAQRKVALQSNGATSFYGGATAYVSAYNAAVNGDTLYLPGGTFPPVDIKKSITIFGVGHHPDSTAVTGATIISGGFNLYGGSADSHIEGLKINGNVGTAGNNDRCLLKRCHVAGSVSLNGDGVRIIENIILGPVNANSSSNMVVGNNIIKYSSQNILTNMAQNAWIHNNVIVGRGYVVSYTNCYLFGIITDCLFENNVIFNEGTTLANVLSPNATNNTFRNNVFNATPVGTDNVWTNNFTGVPSTDFFVSYSQLTFGYNENFSVRNAVYTGVDGKPVGIYGGLSPFKSGSVPVTPHINSLNIATETDAQGKLNVQIKVKAQEN